MAEFSEAWEKSNFKGALDESQGSLYPTAGLRCCPGYRYSRCFWLSYANCPGRNTSLVFLLVIVFGVIAFFEIPRLLQRQYWRELVVFSLLLSLGFALSLLLALRVDLPNSYPTHNNGICKYQPEGYFAKCIIYQVYSWQQVSQVNFFVLSGADLND